MKRCICDQWKSHLNVLSCMKWCWAYWVGAWKTHETCLKSSFSCETFTFFFFDNTSSTVHNNPLKMYLWNKTLHFSDPVHTSSSQIWIKDAVKWSFRETNSIRSSRPAFGSVLTEKVWKVVRIQRTPDVSLLLLGSTVRASPRLAFWNGGLWNYPSSALTFTARSSALRAALVVYQIVRFLGKARRVVGVLSGLAFRHGNRGSTSAEGPQNHRLLGGKFSPTRLIN